MEIADPEDPSALHAVLAHLQEFDLAIFISPNAVTCARRWIQAAGGLPPRIMVAAVGKGSARDLAQLGRPADIVPTGRFDSEALLEDVRLVDMTGKRVIIFRGEGGRELLADELTRRGATVAYAEVYRRVKPAADTAELLRRWARGEIHVAVVTSNESLDNLYDLVGPLARRWLQDTPLVVFSQRTADWARALGFRGTLRVTRQATDAAIVETLVEWRG
jgi:uroporphyrinogen-III synthase